MVELSNVLGTPTPKHRLLPAVFFSVTRGREVGIYRDVVLEDMALASRILKARWPCPWPWPCNGLGFQVFGLGLGLGRLVLGLGSWPWLWKLSLTTLTLALSFQIFNQPSQHPFPFPQVLRFHSWAVVLSWLCGFMEVSPAGSQFPSAPSASGKDLQSSHLGTATEGVQPLWTFYAPAHMVLEWEIGCSQTGNKHV